MTLLDRMGDKFVFAPDGCWLWTGALSSGGYGRVWVNGKQRSAHVVMYEILIGPFPDGLVADHLCRVRNCVNPEHLEPVTFRENILRGEGLTAVRARQTHCIHGHEFTPENTVKSPKGGRHCRACRRSREPEKRRARQRRRREAMSPHKEKVSSK